jgi:chemotaxis protein MotB
MIWPALRRVVGLAVLSMVGLALTGCVAQSEWDRLEEANRSLADQVARLTLERDEARAALDAQRSGLSRGESAVGQLRAENQQLRQQLDAALAELQNLGRRLGDIQVMALDPETDAALRELAAQYPDLIQYDSASGMLRFASDLTFDSGSDAVKGEARAALQALARVLNSPSASGYDVYVEGHTDSQRISPGTARRHPTNRHLSVHRSIAVINELGNMGVPTSRLMAAGWGEYRPRVPNTGSGNTPANRRVEIYLTRPKLSSGAAMGGATTAPAPAPARRPEPEIMK